MKRMFMLFLILLLNITVFFPTSVFADLTKNPQRFFATLSDKVQRSIRSIQYYSVLSIVKGTVTLIAPRNIFALKGSLRSIFLGNDNRIKRKKIIQIKGKNNSESLSLRGRGVNGQGYEFTIPSPSSINEYARASKFVDRLPGSIFITHNNSIRTTFDFEINRIAGKRIKNSGTLNGTFSTRVRGGKAQGRFNLNLSDK